MPAYEYICRSKDCQQTTVISADVNAERPVPECEQCGAIMRRNWNASFILQGSGWAKWDGKVKEAS